MTNYRFQKPALLQRQPIKRTQVPLGGFFPPHLAHARAHSTRMPPVPPTFMMGRSNAVAPLAPFVASHHHPAPIRVAGAQPCPPAPRHSQDDPALQALHGIMALSSQPNRPAGMPLQPLKDASNLPPPATLPKQPVVKGPRLAFAKRLKGAMKSGTVPAHPWTQSEDTVLQALVQRHGEKDWHLIASHFPARNNRQCFHRWKRTLDPAIVKGRWSKDEDDKLRSLVQTHGTTKWSKISEDLPGRIGKQCRERWVHHLQPNVSKDKKWSVEDDRTLLHCYMKLGSCWSLVARMIPGRTDNCVKNHFYVIKKRIVKYLAQVQGVSAAMIDQSSEGRILFDGDLDGVLSAARSSKPGEIAPSDLAALDFALKSFQEKDKFRNQRRVACQV